MLYKLRVPGNFCHSKDDTFIIANCEKKTLEAVRKYLHSFMKLSIVVNYTVKNVV